MDVTGDGPPAVREPRIPGASTPTSAAERRAFRASGGPYPYDRPRALVAPAAWALALGALSLLPVALRAGNAAGLATVLAATPQGQDPAPSQVVTVEQVAANVSAVLLLLAGICACIWLVRLQRVAVRASLLDRYHPESALWIMWAIPLANAVVPCLRIARLDRALHAGRASWTTWAWGVTLWWYTLPVRWIGADSRDLPVLGSDISTDVGQQLAWVRLGVTVLGFALWAVVIVRLTRAGVRVEADTDAETIAFAHR